MCGDYDSVIGMDKGVAAARFWRRVPGERLAPAGGEATICGVFVETADATGLALRVEPVRVGGRLSQAMVGLGAGIQQTAVGAGHDRLPQALVWHRYEDRTQ